MTGRGASMAGGRAPILPFAEVRFGEIRYTAAAALQRRREDEARARAASLARAEEEARASLRKEWARGR